MQHQGSLYHPLLVQHPVKPASFQRRQYSRPGAAEQRKMLSTSRAPPSCQGMIHLALKSVTMSGKDPT